MTFSTKLLFYCCICAYNEREKHVSRFVESVVVFSFNRKINFCDFCCMTQLYEMLACYDCESFATIIRVSFIKINVNLFIKFAISAWLQLWDEQKKKLHYSNLSMGARCGRTTFMWINFIPRIFYFDYYYTNGTISLVRAIINFHLFASNKRFDSSRMILNATLILSLCWI